MGDSFSSYDDQAAIAFIRTHIHKPLANKLSDDMINYFIDLIYDYYESRGYLDEDNEEEEVQIDIEEMVEYVRKGASRDEVGNFTDDEVEDIIQAELDYSESLD
ncbi:hypothetical protein [Falsiporphyromonas endometrii]|uniref:Uncharacterized protein n=1 Tax=Falsiporphyromonas endometrii TaxID=1387297 RepID=A0ABV9K8C7_9PORP|nr:hypothetical protein [Porphyromonadaceae bacterium]